MGAGSERYLAAGVEVTPGTAVTTLKTIRNTGGSGISNERSSITSNEMRSDRAIVESRLGNNAPSISIPYELSYASFEDLMAAAIGHSTTWATVTYTGSTALTIDVDATLKTFTLSTGTWYSKNVRVGDRITFSGFTNAGNNSDFVVTNLNDGVLTAGEAAGLVTESGTGDEAFTATTAITQIKCGTTGVSFTIEEGFDDITEYQYVTGAYVNTWSMSIQPDAVVTGSFDLQAMTYSGFSATPLDSSPDDANTNSVFDTYTGIAYIEGITEPCVITGMDFSVDNGLQRRYAIMEQDACSVGQGRINVTGSLNAYFTSSTMSDKYNNEESFGVSIQLEDLDGNSYIIGIPAVKLTSDSKDISENDVTQTLNFQALGTNITDTTMYIRKQASA